MKNFGKTACKFITDNIMTIAGIALAGVQMYLDNKNAERERQEFEKELLAKADERYILRQPNEETV